MWCVYLMPPVKIPSVKIPRSKSPHSVQAETLLKYVSKDSKTLLFFHNNPQKIENLKVPITKQKHIGQNHIRQNYPREKTLGYTARQKAERMPCKFRQSQRPRRHYFQELRLCSLTWFRLVVSC